MNCIIIILFCKTESTHKHALFTNTAGKPACGVQRRHLHYNLKRYYVVAFETIDLFIIIYIYMNNNKQYVYLNIPMIYYAYINRESQHIRTYQNI